MEVTRMAGHPGPLQVHQRRRDGNDSSFRSATARGINSKRTGSGNVYSMDLRLSGI